MIILQRLFYLFKKKIYLLVMVHPNAMRNNVFLGVYVCTCFIYAYAYLRHMYAYTGLET